MGRAISRMFLFAALLWLVLLQPVWAQQKVILDTDPSSDPDDVGCMAMLHTLASRGECEILAVINSIDHKEGSLCISAVNQFYGRPEIPVGDYKGYQNLKDAPDDLYSHMVAREYPRQLQSHTEAVDSVRLYREILASAKPKSIQVIIIGTMHNFFALLQSSACEFSPLDGQELVREKVASVVTMGGNFIEGKGLDRTNWGGAVALCNYTEWSCLNKERNRMCRYVLENCTAPFVASGWEVGCGDYHDAEQGNVMTGQALKTLDDDHIARRCYEYHFGKRGGSDRIDRHSNDQCALHYAIRGGGANYRAVLGGDIDLSDEGVCSWTEGGNRMQGYIQKKRAPEAIAGEIEELMLGDSVDIKSTPSTPAKLTYKQLDDNRVRLSWEPSGDTQQGNWVVAYQVHRGNELIGIAYGSQFFDSLVPGGDSRAVRYRVVAINAGGNLSKAASVVCSLENR